MQTKKTLLFLAVGLFVNLYSTTAKSRLFPLKAETATNQPASVLAKKATGKPQLTLIYSWNDTEGKWSATCDTVHSAYDMAGNLISELRIGEGWTTKTTYTYNQANRQTGYYSLTMSSLPNEWDTSYAYITEYDQFGNETATYEYSYNGGVKSLSMGRKRAYTYNAENIPLSSVVTKWDEDKGEYVNEERETYTYDNQNRVTELLYESWDDNAKDFIINSKLTDIVWHKWGGMFSETSSPLSYEMKIWTGTEFENGERYTAVYENDILKDAKYETWDNNAWVIEDWEKFDLTFTDGNLTERIASWWENDDFRKVNKEVYSNFKTSTGLASVSNSSVEVSLFPNPATQYVKLSTTSIAKKLTVCLYDISGKELLNQNLIHSETTIDCSGLNAGLYFYRILSADGIVSSGKLILK